MYFKFIVHSYFGRTPLGWVCPSTTQKYLYITSPIGPMFKHINRASASKFRHIMSAVGEVPLLRSSKNVWKQLTQGLRPGLCRSIAPLGLTHAYVMCTPKWVYGCLVGSGRGKKCRRHDTPAKPRVARVPKARTEPWVYTDRSGLSSVGAALSARVFALYCCGSWLCIRWESAAPVGAQKCMSMINPGLAPRAMQECRPYRALSVSDTKPQSISMHQHIRINECPTTAIQSNNNPSHH